MWHPILILILLHRLSQLTCKMTTFGIIVFIIYLILLYSSMTSKNEKGKYICLSIFFLILILLND